MRVLYQRSVRRDETWLYSLAGLEDSLERIGMAAVPYDPSPASTFVARGLGKLRLLRRIAQLREEAVLVALMGPMESRLFPRCFFGNSVVYCFDCWPRDRNGDARVEAGARDSIFRLHLAGDDADSR